MGVTSSTNIQQELDKLKDEIKTAGDQEAFLDGAIATMQQSLRSLAEDGDSSSHAYMTHDDIRGIGAFAQDTVIAIKAPSGTTLEVPDPDEGMEYPQRRYQIYLKSSAGPVEVFLVSQAADEGAEGAEGGADAAAAAAAVPAPAHDADGAHANGKRTRDELAAVTSPARPAAGAAPDASSLLKLSPVGAEQADYWNAAALDDGGGGGVNDLFGAPDGGGA